jgi:hypothetical protein
MREAFVHEASIELERGADERAPGAAVTVGLCGHWQHEGPCRWPHHSSVERSGQMLVIRVVFVADPADEQDVRQRIDRALRLGTLDGPTGTSRWAPLHTGSSVLRPDEEALGEKLSTA